MTVDKDIFEAHQAQREETESDDKFEAAQNPETSEEPEPTEEQSPSKTKEQELEELNDQYKRLLADYQNQSKRFAKEREEAYKYASVSTIELLLPALDNFDFAKKSFTDGMKKEEIEQGINTLQEQIFMALKGAGLEIINTDCEFNPELHEAISTIKDPSKKEGSIIEVVKKGYKVKDRVIRPASVVVSSK